MSPEEYQSALTETIHRMKAEIMTDMALGIVPKTCKSFAELHDYVDANYYGGFYHNGYLEKLFGFDGFASDDACPEDLKGLMWSFVNDAQNEVSRWLREIVNEQ